LRGAADLTLLDVSRKGEGAGSEAEKDFVRFERHREGDDPEPLGLPLREYALGCWSSAAPRAAGAIPGRQRRCKLFQTPQYNAYS